MILPIVIISIEGSSPNVVSDIDRANVVWGNEIGVFVDVIANLEIDRPDLVVLTQNDCSGIGHVVSDEEDELFDLGRGLGTDLVGYYIREGIGGARGCAAHPPGRRGFWVGDTATEWTFIHEATHVVGRNFHVGDTDNLMFGSTAGITNLPPDLDENQKTKILNDPALLSISSIVLNL